MLMYLKNMSGGCGWIRLAKCMDKQRVLYTQ